MEVELSQWKFQTIKWVLPPSSIPTHKEPEAPLPPIHTNLAKKKKMYFQEILKSAFKLLPTTAILKDRIILCWWGEGALQDV